MTWCKDTARDAAVRAAEDNRTGPLPTLADVIAAPFAEPAKRSPTVSETGEGQSGLRTERITLEVTHDLDARLSDWIVEVVDESLGLMESVRVVHEPKLASHANADGEANHAVQAASGGGVIREMTDILRSETADADEKHAALATLVEAVCPGWALTQAASGAAVAWEHDIPTPHGTGRGVVLIDPFEYPELWEEATGMPVSNARPLVYKSAQAASGGGDAQGVSAGTSSAPAGDSGQNGRLEAASGSGKPVAWMCEWTDHVSLHHTKTDAEDEANGDIVPQPLYRSPPQPRGWLTEDERKWIEYMKGNCVLPYAGMACMEAILARSSPPEVVLSLSAYLVRENVIAALKAAGVAVKEVGK